MLRNDESARGGKRVQRHETDPLSLAFALIFIIVGAAFWFGDIDAFEFISVWALPVVLVSAGLVLGAVALIRYRRNH